MDGPRVTLDTKCIINLFDRESRTATSVASIETLSRYSFDGKLELAITTRLEKDLERDKNKERRKTLISKLNIFPIIPSVLRWNVSKWGSDSFADVDTMRVTDEIKKILSPGLTPESPRYSNKINDIDQLAGHLIGKRDIFVTDDTGILRKREQLKTLGIAVMGPADCVAFVDSVVLRSKPRTFPSDKIPLEYHLRALSGSVTFDYTNNNGTFAVGEAQYLFETKWTKASNTAIHAYSDGASIGALSIAKGVSSISEIMEAQEYDYSSRARTPKLGEIIVWRNQNGLYAATLVRSIKDDSRGDDTNELSLEYVILAEGGCDFSEVG